MLYPEIIERLSLELPPYAISDVRGTDHATPAGAILQYGLDALRHDILSRCAGGLPDHVEISIVICPYDGPGTRLLACRGSQVRQEDMLGDGDLFQPIGEAIASRHPSKKILHFRGIARLGHLSAHGRLDIMRRLEALARWPQKQSQPRSQAA